MAITFFSLAELLGLPLDSLLELTEYRLKQKLLKLKKEKEIAYLVKHLSPPTYCKQVKKIKWSFQINWITCWIYRGWTRDLYIAPLTSTNLIIIENFFPCWIEIHVLVKRFYWKGWTYSLNEYPSEYPSPKLAPGISSGWSKYLFKKLLNLNTNLIFSHRILRNQVFLELKR